MAARVGIRPKIGPPVDDRSWVVEANCLDRPELFWSSKPEDIELAIGLCDTCPVIVECRQDLNVAGFMADGVRAGVRWTQSLSGSKVVADPRYSRKLSRRSAKWFDVMEHEDWVTIDWLALQMDVEVSSAERQMYRWLKVGKVETREVELASGNYRAPARLIARARTMTPETRREWRLL